MPERISEAEKKEKIAKKTIAIFRKNSGREWDLPYYDVLTLIESYFEAREKIGCAGLAKGRKK